jgi:hypothetical protein
VGFLDEFAEAGERGLQFGHRECDGVHVVCFPFVGCGNKAARTSVRTCGLFAPGLV